MDQKEKELVERLIAAEKALESIEDCTYKKDCECPKCSYYRKYPFPAKG